MNRLTLRLVCMGYVAILSAAPINVVAGSKVVFATYLDCRVQTIDVTLGRFTCKEAKNSAVRMYSMLTTDADRVSIYNTHLKLN